MDVQLHFAHCDPVALSSTLSRARHYVSRISGAVEGEHGDDRTLIVANILVWDFGLTTPDALTIFREYNQRCLPPWSEQELIRKLKSAERQPHKKPRGNLLNQKSALLKLSESKPSSTSQSRSIDPTVAVKHFLKGFECNEVDLWEASPIRLPNEWTDDAIVLLECLFQRNEQINFVTNYELTSQRDGTTKANPKGYGRTVERDNLVAEWLANGLPASKAGGWLRMNPLDGSGIHDANVTAFRFTLLESDVLAPALTLALFAKLPLPISAILTSGGRGPHAWVLVDADTAKQYETVVSEIMHILDRLGIDGANKNPSRLSRLPGVIRQIGARGDGKQRLLYLNPRPDQNSIL